MAFLSVDFKLRVAQVMSMALAVTSGLTTGIGMGWTSYIFNYNCILNSDLHFKSGTNKTVYLDTENTNFGSIRVCHYCTFAPVVAAIYAVMWFWFFVFLSDWKKGERIAYRVRWVTTATTIRRLRKLSPPDSRVLIPTLMLSVLLWICCLVALVLLSHGVNSLCNNILQTHSTTCYEVAKMRWEEKLDVWMVYVYLKVAQAGNWVLVMSLAAAVFIVIARLCLWNSQGHQWEVTGRTDSFESQAPSENLIPPNNSDTEETCFNAMDTNIFFNQTFTSPRDLLERCALSSGSGDHLEGDITRRCNTL